MIMKYSAAAFTALALATPAMADITTDDVWTNTLAYYSATGGVLDGTVERTGDVLVVNDMALTYTFPFGFGMVTLTLPPMTLTENGDGTVAIGYPDTFALTGTLDITNEMNGSATLQVTQADFVGTASGTPGDITYDMSSGPLTLELTDVSSPDEDLDGLDIVMRGESEGFTISNRITEGTLIESTTNLTLLPTATNYSINIENDFKTKSAARYQTTTTTTRVALPAGGSDIVNLTPAFEAGLLFESRSVAEGGTTRTTTSMDGELVSDQTTSSGTSNATVRLDASGLVFEGAGNDFIITMQDQFMFPAPIEAQIAEVSANYLLPILASDDLQDFRFQIGMDGMTLSDDIWAMFDPAAELPRDPATVRMDVSGAVKSAINVFDFLAYETLFNSGQMPIEIDRLNISDITIRGVNASATASGEFAFDNTDLETFNGVPRPEGSAAVEVVGANALIDRLVAMGLLPEQQAGMGRMMMGMFARQTGDDTIYSEVNINPEGQVLVNGERVR